ncbi:hypothetical protein, partial [Pseudomonas capsici]|uniref:hypothetical protein n=1 Tax=Pseudomonas capsici TaxID=2810614 RepID=UPI0021F13F3E
MLATSPLSPASCLSSDKTQDHELKHIFVGVKTLSGAVGISIIGMCWFYRFRLYGGPLLFRQKR